MQSRERGQEMHMSRNAARDWKCFWSQIPSFGARAKFLNAVVRTGWRGGQLPGQRLALYRRTEEWVALAQRDPSPPRHPHRDWRKALVTLHSGRSCRDTPAPLCSTAGTGPARHRGGQREKWGREDIGQLPEVSAPFPSPAPRGGRALTSVCTMAGRCVRKVFTV